MSYSLASMLGKGGRDSAVRTLMLVFFVDSWEYGEILFFESLLHNVSKHVATI